MSLALFFLLLFFCMPRRGSQIEQRLTNEVNLLASLCTHLQQKALAVQKEQHLFFDLENNSYSYSANGKVVVHKLPAAIEFGFCIPLLGPPGRPRKQPEIPVTFPFIDRKRAASFYQDESMSQGTVYLTDHSKNCVKALTSSVAHVSYIRKYHYSDSTWVPF